MSLRRRHASGGVTTDLAPHSSPLRQPADFAQCGAQPCSQSVVLARHAPPAASHSRSFGPTNRASRAHPARNPADASARGFTANHRLSSRSTSGFGLGLGEYATKLPGGSKSLAQLVDLLGEF
jgi:hypothetical protein